MAAISSSMDRMTWAPLARMASHGVARRISDRAHARGQRRGGAGRRILDDDAVGGGGSELSGGE